jgi:hypothetical protein
MDKSPGEQEAFQFHPLINTATLVVSRANLQRFLTITGHDVNELMVPSQNT